MNRSIAVDVAIFGGGVAGLWLLNRLRSHGYNTLLLESDALGAGQTRYAQGIIHGGTKYALTGMLTGSSATVAEMPALWRAALAGAGEIDLRGVKVLSEHQYLWSTRQFSSRMAGFFASRVMRSRTAPLSPNQRPDLFRHEQFRGEVYRLDEPVLDTASLVTHMAATHRGAILNCGTPCQVALNPNEPGVIQLREGEESLSIKARAVVLTAGKGNGELLHSLQRSEPQMQLRPLKMVMVRSADWQLNDGVYAHCLGASTNPRVTVSSHRDRDGRVVWYLGGELAEQGVARTDGEQIEAARKELQELLPWLDWRSCDWATLDIDRAEPQQSNGGRPVDVYANYQQGVITAWPTKLVLAPRLAAEIEQLLVTHGIGASSEHTAPPKWSRPAVASLPWQQSERWKGVLR